MCRLIWKICKLYLNPNSTAEEHTVCPLLFQFLSFILAIRVDVNPESPKNDNSVRHLAWANHNFYIDRLFSVPSIEIVAMIIILKANQIFVYMKIGMHIAHI